ncbi:SurA N-terminal domain-containing protein [Hyphococcus lacteus]|uniref:peptidylprolyl isomerase n=1 Tax=Hyphococcus lacteus TaxID=3143536 RepID=A0ABV3Z4L6_9PROT
MENKSSRPTALLFLVASFLGLAGAVITALGEPAIESSNSAVAFVNGKPIPEMEYARAVDAMQAGLDRGLKQEDKIRALQILIDEELIVQEALTLDLASDDRLVRKNLVQAMIRSAISLRAVDQPTEDDLKALYTAELNLFVSPRRVTVKAYRAEDVQSSKRFSSAIEDGASFSSAGIDNGLEELTVPSGLPLAKLSDYLGGSVRNVVVNMSNGDIAGPINTINGDVFLWLMDGTNPIHDFALVRDSVEAEWLKRRDEAALQSYIDQLRKKARIKKIIELGADT